MRRPDRVDRDGDGDDETVPDATIGAVVTWGIDRSVTDTRDFGGDVTEACAPPSTYPLRGAVVANGLHVLPEQTRTVTVH